MTVGTRRLIGGSTWTVRQCGSTNVRSGFKLLDGHRSELISLGPSQTGGTYLVWSPLGRGPREHSRRWAPRLTRSTGYLATNVRAGGRGIGLRGPSVPGVPRHLSIGDLQELLLLRVWSCSRLPTSFDVMPPSPSRLRLLRTQRADAPPIRSHTAGRTGWAAEQVWSRADGGRMHRA